MRYQDAFDKKSLLLMSELFTEDASIEAPISGTMQPRPFHSYMFEVTKKTALRFARFRQHATNPRLFTLQFCFTLSVATGDVTVIEGSMSGELDAGLRQFKKLKFDYNPNDVRGFMEKLGIAPPQGS